ncbi:hypothetical protein GALL_253200 [mine drainage metagenome]|uniref:Uncharacterized protein n=1 Tax=mine drainage metagenome TaxID=410659 RepID=A0A1J5RX55_9ZZZZ
MHPCPRCETDYASATWHCPHCEFTPLIRDGRRVFAPDLAETSEAFPAEAHRRFEDLQDTSFWFRARNALLQGLAGKYFASARSFMEIGCGTGYVLAGLQQALPSARVFGNELYSEGSSRVVIARKNDFVQS